jgi:hypothetical protein
MIGRRGTDVEQIFRRQFECENGRLVFRQNQRAAPVPISESEMEQCVEEFRKRYRVVMIGGVAVMMAVIVTLVAVGADDWLNRDGFMWLLVDSWATAFLIAFRWAWRSPTTDFAQRMPIGLERSREDVRRTMLAQRSYLQLLGLAAFGLFLATLKTKAWPPTTVDDWVSLIGGGFIAVMACWSVLRKWSFERDQG